MQGGCASSLVIPLALQRRACLASSLADFLVGVFPVVSQGAQQVCLGVIRVELPEDDQVGITAVKGRCPRGVAGGRSSFGRACSKW